MTTTTENRGNGSPQADPAVLRLDTPGPQQRRPRTSWIALGLLVLVGFGLLGAVTVARVAGREPVVALAQAVDRGEQLTPADLMIVNVGTDDNVAVVPSDARDDLVGLTATARLEAGTLISPGQFAEGPSVAAGASVVGMALAPGQYPTVSLRPGDRVVVVRTPAPTPTANGAASATVLAERAEVFAVESLSETARTLMVSIVVSEDAVPEVAAAAAADRIRLGLVAQP